MRSSLSSSSPRSQKAGKLDVELGKAVGIQRTKAGSGDKEEAFLIRSTLLKFAGAFCLIFVVVGGLAIFLSQWEVSFQKGINLDERVEHQAVEEEGLAQFMQVGGMLSSFLREETGKKNTVTILQGQVEGFLTVLQQGLETASSSDEVHALVQVFTDQVYGILDEYADLVSAESRDAKVMLGQLNKILADDDVMPESREKIRTAPKGGHGAKNMLQRAPRAGAPRDRSDPGMKSGGAKQKLAALGGDLNAVLTRIFDRVDSLSQLSFPDDVKDGLMALQHDLTAMVAQKQDISNSGLLNKYKQLLSSPGVRGVDVAAAASSERQMVITLKEIVQLFPVLDHADDLETVKLKWESHTINEGETMHTLHKMTRDHILPFEWVAGTMLGGGKQPRNGPPGKKNVFSRQAKYQWWQGLDGK